MEQNKKKLTFNFIDLILIVTALAAITFLVYNLVAKKVSFSGDETVKVEYTVSVDAMHDELRDYVKSSIGQTVTELTMNKTIGEISNVYCTDAQYIGTDEGGNTVKTEYSGKTSADITVTVYAKRTKTCYTADGIELILGKELSIRTSRFEARGVISEITVENEG